MKKIDWLILILIVAIVIAAILWTPKSSDNSDENKQSKLDLFKARLKQVEDKIESEMKTLQLTKETEAFLEKRVSRQFAVFKFLVVASFTFGCYLFLGNGYDWLNALLMTSSIFGLALASTCFLFISKILDINTLLDFVRSRMRKSIHKKYGYDPTSAVALQQSITLNTNEADNLQQPLSENCLPTKN
jgi:Na+/H+ antiporter NhaC